MRQTIVDHQSQWEALRSFELWALFEDARERGMTEAEREAFHELSEWTPEDRKPAEQMLWVDWVTLWAHWMTVHYQYLHAQPDDVVSHEASRHQRFQFDICEC